MGKLLETFHDYGIIVRYTVAKMHHIQTDVVKTTIKVIQASTFATVLPTNTKHKQDRVSRSSLQHENAFKQT
jgi:hypothetical protein